MEDVQDILIRFVNGFSKLDLEKTVSCFSDDATSFFPIAHHTTFLDGKHEIREAFASVISKIKAAGHNSIRLEPEDIKIQKLGEAAIVTFHIRDRDLSRRTLILRNTREGWIIQHLHASNAPLEEE
jgi:ketosteroid isomerase-like protein